MNYKFSDRVRQALARARANAIRLSHDYMGTEHLLLGLLDATEGTAVEILEELEVRPDDVRATIEGAVRRGKATIARGELPYTSRAKKTIEYAMAAARETKSEMVGTEHLLLGLLMEEKGIAAQALVTSGVTVDKVRAALAGVSPDSLDADVAGAPRPARPRAKRGPVLDTEPVWFLEVDPSSDTPIYEQIIAGIEEAVATNRLEVGERLPTVRQLAEELGVAPGTVARAYSQLEKNGVLETEGARGTRVAARTPTAKPVADRASTLEHSLRVVVVQGYHLGASADELRGALERAMGGIFDS